MMYISGDVHNKDISIPLPIKPVCLLTPPCPLFSLVPVRSCGILMIEKVTFLLVGFEGKYSLQAKGRVLSLRSRFPYLCLRRRIIYDLLWLNLLQEKKKGNEKKRS